VTTNPRPSPAAASSPSPPQLVSAHPPRLRTSPSRRRRPTRHHQLATPKLHGRLRWSNPQWIGTVRHMSDNYVTTRPSRDSDDLFVAAEVSSATYIGPSFGSDRHTHQQRDGSTSPAAATGTTSLNRRRLRQDNPIQPPFTPPTSPPPQTSPMRGVGRHRPNPLHPRTSLSPPQVLTRDRSSPADRCRNDNRRETVPCCH